MTTIPQMFPELYTADDVAEAERDIAYLVACREDETDPGEVAMLDDWIAYNKQWLAEMAEVVWPALSLVLPNASAQDVKDARA